MYVFYILRSVENKLSLKRGCDLTPDRMVKRSRPVDQTVEPKTPTRRIPVVKSLVDSLEKLKLSQPGTFVLN